MRRPSGFPVLRKRMTAWIGQRRKRSELTVPPTLQSLVPLKVFPCAPWSKETLALLCKVLFDQWFYIPIEFDRSYATSLSSQRVWDMSPLLAAEPLTPGVCCATVTLHCPTLSWSPSQLTSHVTLTDRAENLQSSSVWFRSLYCSYWFREFVLHLELLNS